MYTMRITLGSISQGLGRKLNSFIYGVWSKVPDRVRSHAGMRVVIIIIIIIITLVIMCLDTA